MNENVSERVKAYVELLSKHFKLSEDAGGNYFSHRVSMRNLIYDIIKEIALMRSILTREEINDFERIVDTELCPIACPKEGSFYAYKKCNGSKWNKDPKYIVKLFVPADAKRSSAFSEKCRCDKATVVEIINPITGRKCKRAYSAYDKNFVYEVNKEVKVKDFDEYRWNECSTGIHFFMTREEAEKYNLY